MTRSVVLLTAAWCLSACECGSVERGRYQCDPTVDAGTALSDQQCPGASRCGLEGYCHNSGDTSVAWRCHDRTNCENGWECGLSRDHSFRECHDPDASDAGFPCEADTDCVRGFHCGVQQRCYDRGQKMAFPCGPDAGDSDCADGWRCGLSLLCHDRAVPDAYACGTDFDCEGGWRCGLAHVCLDPSADALRPVSTTLGFVEKVNPLLLDHAPEQLAVSPVQRPSFNDPRQHLVYYDRGAINVLDLSVGGIPPIGTNPHRVQTLPDAGEVVALASLGATSLDVFAVPDVGSWTYLARPDGRLLELHFRTTNNTMGYDGTPFREVVDTFSFDLVSNSVTTDWIRVGSTEEGFVPTMTAYNRGEITDPGWQYFYGWGARSRASFSTSFYGYASDTIAPGSAFAFQGNRIVDLATVTAHRLGQQLGAMEQTDCSVIADQRGLFVQQHEISRTGLRRYAARPLIVPPFSNGFCEATTGVPQSHRITGLSGYGRDFIAVSAHPLTDGGVERVDDTEVALIDVSNWWEVVYPDDDSYPFRGCLSSFGAQCGSIFLPPKIEFPVVASTVLGPCRVCVGGALVALSALPGAGNTMKLEARCRSNGADGGSPTDAIVELSRGAGQGTACQRQTLELRSGLGVDPVKISATNASQLAFAGPRGHLWAGRSSGTASPVFFDQAPTGVVTDPNSVPVFLGIDRIGWFAPGFGILAFSYLRDDSDRPVSGVDGDRKALVTGGRAVVTFDGVAPGAVPRVIAATDGTPTRFDAPYHAVRAVRTDGANVILVSADDILFAANVDLAKPVLQRRLVPAEGKAIISLLALPKASSGPLLTSFALTANGLFKITAETDQLWTATQAPLPPGEPIELWADGKRGRIGYADGQVFSLETRVQIGAPLFKRVDDFAQVCGQVYALAEGTLNQLTLTSGAVGQWKTLPLDAGLPPSELEQGSILPFSEADGGTSLYVFSRRGEAVRASVEGCVQ